LLFTATCYPSSFVYFVSLILAHHSCIPLLRRHPDSTGNHERTTTWSRCMDTISPLKEDLTRIRLYAPYEASDWISTERLYPCFA
jgi:hypothetical protein